MIDPAYVKANFPGIRPSWLAAAREEVLEPALPVIDAHHHLWALPEATYLRRELLDDLGSGHNVVATVYVDCHSSYFTDGPEALRPVGETVFAVRETQGAPHGAAGGIVGWADLMLGEDVRPVLQQHLEAGAGRFRGVRTRAAWHAHPTIHPAGMTQPGMLLQPALQAGARVLGKMDLVLDVWVYHTQLAEVAALADACPDTTLVLDHCGCPLGVGPYASARDDVFQAWSADLRAVTRRPNVLLKLGGLAMPRFGHRLHERPMAAGSTELVALWRPYLQTCVESFGTARCMFESNFPVDKGGVGYRVLWNAFKRFALGATPSEKADLFSRTAARAYRLQGVLDAA